jgi:hypothetical protein
VKYSYQSFRAIACGAVARFVLPVERGGAAEELANPAPPRPPDALAMGAADVCLATRSRSDEKSTLCAVRSAVRRALPVPPLCRSTHELLGLIRRIVENDEAEE